MRSAPRGISRASRYCAWAEPADDNARTMDASRLSGSCDPRATKYPYHEPQQSKGTREFDQLQRSSSFDEESAIIGSKALLTADQPDSCWLSFSAITGMW